MFSATSTLELPVHTWENIKHCTSCDFDFWPGLRTDVIAWVKGCAHCLSYNVWVDRKQELHLYFPVTIQLYTMHVNLWAPGTALSNNSSGHNLLNAMCDLTQFVVLTYTTETHAEHLAKLFIENVVLLFGMVAILVVKTTVGPRASSKICAHP